MFNSHSLGMQCMYVSFFFFFFFIMVWNYYFISARWLPPLRINKVKVKVNVDLKIIMIMMCVSLTQFATQVVMFITCNGKLLLAVIV